MKLFNGHRCVFQAGNHEDFKKFVFCCVCVTLNFVDLLRVLSFSYLIPVVEWNFVLSAQIEVVVKVCFYRRMLFFLRSLSIHSEGFRPAFIMIMWLWLTAVRLLEYSTVTARVIYSDSAATTFTGIQWTNVPQETALNAGALTLWDSSHVTCDDCQFIGTSTGTGKNGGAINCNCVPVEFINCLFKKCSSGGTGGAINLQYGSPLTVDRCIFTTCTSVGRGSAIHVAQGTEAGTPSPVIIENSEVTDCKGSNDESVLSMTSISALTFSGNTITCNLPAATVTAIAITFSDSVSLTIEDSVFSNSNEGAGQLSGKFWPLNVTYSALKFKNVSFDSISSSAIRGCGISPATGQTGAVTIEACNFTVTSTQKGAAICTECGASVTITACQIEECTSSAGGAVVYLSGFTELSVTNCHFISNSVTGSLVQSLEK